MRLFCTIGLTILGVVGFLGGEFSLGSEGEMATQAVGDQRSLTMEEAISLAKQAHPGQVLEAEKEREGTTVWYDIKIAKTDGTTQEIEINAHTGAIGPGELDDDDDKNEVDHEEEDDDDDEDN